MELRASAVFAALGTDIPLQGLLIGVRAPDFKEGHGVCLVPEDDDLDPGNICIMSRTFRGDL